MMNSERMIAEVIDKAFVNNVRELPSSTYFMYGGHNFRPLLHDGLDELQMGSADFDRWANSVAGRIVPCPRTPDAMYAAVTYLLVHGT